LDGYISFSHPQDKNGDPHRKKWFFRNNNDRVCTKKGSDLHYRFPVFIWFFGFLRSEDPVMMDQGGGGGGRVHSGNAPLGYVY
jgi:hypothetical protein